MTTTTIRLEWAALPSPSVNGLGGGKKGAGSVLTAANQGVTQTQDGRAIIVWNAGQAQAFLLDTGVWTAPATLDSSAQPQCWSAIYHGRAYYYDNHRGTFALVDWNDGTELTIATSAALFDCQRFPSPSSTRYRFNVGASLLSHPKLPGLHTTAYQDLFGTSVLVLLEGRGKSPYPLAVRKFTNAQLPAFILGNNSYVEPNPIAGANGSIIPGLTLNRPSVGQPGIVAGPVCDLSTVWNILTYGLQSVPVPWFQFYNGSTPWPMTVIPQTDAGINLYTITPDNFSAFVGGLAQAFPYVTTAPAAYARGLLNGNALGSVIHQPFNLTAQTLGLPVAVPAPSPLDGTSWALFNPGSIPYVLDQAGRFYSLQLAMWDNVQLPLSNWVRRVVQ